MLFVSLVVSFIEDFKENFNRKEGVFYAFKIFDFKLIKNFKSIGY